jgi:hypothetical protein
MQNTSVIRPLSILIALVAVCFVSCTPAQGQEKKAPQTTVIHLADLPQTDFVLKKQTLESYFTDLKDYEFPADNQISSVMLNDSMVFCSQPFLTSARLAYGQHRPLVISPDIVWLVIECGFAKYVENNVETLRSKFVNFEGKKELTMVTETPHLLSQPAEAWAPVFEQFGKQIALWTGNELVETLHADFSTTTPASSVASYIMLMSIMQYYFDYSILSICGIPDIHLEGTADDWNRLVQKANALRKYDLDWWINELEPILRKIAAAAEGERDIAFWQSIIRKKDIPVVGEETCGVNPPREKIDGWIVKFYPFTETGNMKKMDFLYDTDISNLPSEVGVAPVTYTDVDGTVYDLDVHAGLVGIKEDSLTRALRPTILWWVSRPKGDGQRYKQNW